MSAKTRSAELEGNAKAGDELALRAGFLEAMSLAANTVYVVTTDGPAGRAGVTVSAFSSVSADVDEPRLLICLHHESVTAEMIRRNGVFCVNMLSAGRSGLANRFAGRLPEGEDKFAQGDWCSTDGGLPRLQDALASFECRLSEQSLVGTHHVLFGAVGAVYLADAEHDANPLVYARRSYAQLTNI